MMRVDLDKDIKRWPLLQGFGCDPLQGILLLVL